MTICPDSALVAGCLSKQLLSESYWFPAFCMHLCSRAERAMLIEALCLALCRWRSRSFSGTKPSRA
eukprot:2829374-Alexandrium_andersonii.AAC.2